MIQFYILFKEHAVIVLRTNTNHKNVKNDPAFRNEQLQVKYAIPIQATTDIRE